MIDSVIDSQLYAVLKLKIFYELIDIFSNYPLVYLHLQIPLRNEFDQLEFQFLAFSRKKLKIRMPFNPRS